MSYERQSLNSSEELYACRSLANAQLHGPRQGFAHTSSDGDKEMGTVPSPQTSPLTGSMEALYESLKLSTHSTVSVSGVDLGRLG